MTMCLLEICSHVAK